MKSLSVKLVIVASTVLGLVLLVGVRIMPWSRMNWGSIQTVPGRTVTVVGEARTSQVSQLATFSAGIGAVMDDKEAAIKEVNAKTEALLEALKKFGIKDEDIKTQNLSYYQNQEQYYDNGRQKMRPGQWSVNNSVDITLRDVSKVSDLAALLAASGANNVYGPNFSVNDSSEVSNSLIDDAIKDARTKATEMASTGGLKLGKILSVTEGVTIQNPVNYGMGMEKGMGGGGVPLVPGGTVMLKQVTVVFELQ